MPTAFFADLDALRLALASGAVPPAVAAAPARAGFDAHGHLWLEPGVPLPRDAAAALARLGAPVQGTSAAELAEEVSCWPQLLPLRPTADEGVPPVALFTVPDGARLPRLTAELRRLGAGRLGLRWLDAAGPPQALLIVERPPLSALLLAEAGGPGAPAAFVPLGPRVWVERGYRHPLADPVQPPADRIVLLGAPRAWTVLPDGPFRTGPDLLPLPRRPAGLADRADVPRLPLGLRLVPGRAAEPAELWVLRERAGPQLRTLAEQSDDALIARLSLAVIALDGERVAVLRVLPGRGAPPVLVLDALACRPHLRLPNLFVPSGLTVRPPLRRDAVRGLLATDPARVSWLEPQADGGFAFHTLPEAAFRPLAGFVTYPRDHEPEAVQPAAGESRFSLPPFTVREPEPAPRRRPRPAPTPALAPPPTPAPAAEPADGPTGWLQRIVDWFRPRPGGEEADEAPPAPISPSRRSPDAPAAAPTWEQRRRDLEARFVRLDGPPDAPERRAAWPELAALYANLRQPADAALCWLNALWDVDPPPAPWARGWLRAESGGRAADVTPERWLSGPPTPAAVRAVAAYTVWAAAQEPPPAALAPALGRVQQLLDRHEALLPVRAAWLARVALARQTGGDVVGLARARDRLLERLYRSGLSADQDVPAFLRFAGQGSGERLQEVRRWLAGAREPIHRWLAERADRPDGVTRYGPESSAAPDPQLQAFGLGAGGATRFTRAYADLVLAWGQARLGERAACQELLARARAVLGGGDAVHTFLLDAYAHRAGQGLEGRPGAGPLPPDLLARLDALDEAARRDPKLKDQMQRYKAEKLREFSRVLEPAEKMDAYRPVVALHGDELQRALAAAQAAADPDDLVRQFGPLLAQAARQPALQARVLGAALEVAPRAGAAFAEGLLDQLGPLVERATFAGPPEQIEAEARVLERGLFVAAHFDRAEAVTRLLAGFDRLLDSRRGDAPAGHARAEAALVALLGQGLRGLRRLGLRAEAERLLGRLTDWVMPTPDLAALRRRRPAAWPAALRRLLALAGGWYAAGQDDRAEAVLDEARALLFAGELRLPEQTELAVAYVDALGQAPPRLALGRVDEVFGRLRGVSDTLLTTTHYALARLRVVEAAVLAVVNDDFTLGPAVRRWLDDDEYIVRRRIHRDLRAALGG